jgi:arginyl-tRNA synthetase
MPSAWSTILGELRSAVAAVLPTVPSERIAFETPPNPSMGDVAVPCFQLARSLKQPPPEIATRIAEALAGHPLVAKATVAGPFVNVVLDAAELARRVLTAIAEVGEAYGGRESGIVIRSTASQPVSASSDGIVRTTTPYDDTSRDAVLRSTTPEAPSGERVVLEYISPNANKPLHLGHLRNAFLGEAIARCLEARGHDVHRVCLVNDRGVHIMKSLLAYARWGKGATPESARVKGDHFVGDWYVRFDAESRKQRAESRIPDDQPTPLEREAAEWLRKWEAGDAEVRALWERMTNWVLAGFRESYATIGVSFEREYCESDIYEDGRRIVADALAKGVFQKDTKGNTIASLKDRFGLDDKVVERADGTTVYATQDLALAHQKARDLHPDRSIIITGNEQDYYFRQLFAIFELLGMSGANRNRHRSYGMVELPEGKMKSREGTVVDADDLIAELTRLAEEEIRKRADAIPGEPDAGTDEPPVVVSAAALARAREVALAAIRFHLLLVTPETTVTFNPRASLQFTGKTGPYIQYMHARICSIFRKRTIEQKNYRTIEQSVLQFSGPKVLEFASLLREASEQQLLLRLARFPDVVAAAADQLDPSGLAQELYDLAQTFADFYRDVPVLRADTVELRDARLALCDAVRVTLARGLTLLGIAPLSEM